MFRILKLAVYFSFLAGVGILLGCYIHGSRVNQDFLMSGVQFVRELPYGEQTVGRIETLVFSYQEKQNLERFEEAHKGQIKIDPEQLKKHQELMQRSQPGRP
jgi:hypothetical protein